MTMYSSVSGLYDMYPFKQIEGRMTCVYERDSDLYDIHLQRYEAEFTLVMCHVLTQRVLHTTKLEHGSKMCYKMCVRNSSVPGDAYVTHDFITHDVCIHRLKFLWLKYYVCSLLVHVLPDCVVEPSRGVGC